MVELTTGFFSADGFMPHGTCYLWRPGILSLHVVSDGVIGVSYIAIAAMLVWLWHRARGELPFHRVVIAFGVFIVTCGFTHLLEVYTVWQPAYWLSGGVKAATAAASLATAMVLPGLLPRVLGTLEDARLSRARRRELESTVAELRESEARFREAFDNAPIGKGLVALDGRLMRVNRALCEITGYAEAELLGMTFQEVTQPDDLAADLEMSHKLAAGEVASYQVEKRYQRGDGSSVWVLLNRGLVRDEGGRPLYFIAQVLDIDARKAAEERERELLRAQAAQSEAEAAARRLEFVARASNVLASSLDYEATLQSVARLMVPELGDYCLLDLLDDDGEIRRVAVAHADPAREPLVQAVRQFPPLPTDIDHPVIQAMATGRPVAGDHVELPRLATRGPAHVEAGLSLEPRSFVTLPLIASGKVLGTLTTVLDAHSERSFEPVEISLAEEIARRAAVAVENARLYRSAEEANRAKADFLTVMSHELRTPLNAVVGYTDLLQAGVPGPLTTKQAEYLDRVRRSASHLLALIEEVLTYARLEAGRESIRRDVFELDDVVRHAAALVEPLAAERHLSFEVHVPEQPVRLETDARKVRQMIANLLSNALKFTERGGVALRATDAGDDVLIAISDTGIGIPPEHLERVFDPFWQADSSTTRRTDGTGLGLGVTRRLARLLGGDVTLRSKVGQGSTFTLRLPKRVPPAA